MKSRLFSAISICQLILISTSLNAATIVDTGPGPNVAAGSALGADPAAQWLAAEFTTTDDYTITDVEGWIAPFFDGGDGTVAIYTDGGDVPGTELFAAPFLGFGPDVPSWTGASGLSWALPAGTYWVSFEVRPGQVLEGVMPDPSPNPLLNEAFSNDFGVSWFGQDDIDIGVRIQAVPLPPALYLFGTGLLGLIGISRKKKAA
jgi:hypothetical protein